MAHYHVHLSYVSKGHVKGGARGFHRYLSREGREDGQQFHRYLMREDAHHQGKDDLVARDHGNLPTWAESPEHFWQMADKLERAKGPVFWHLQVALPRELSPQGREALARDVVEAVVGKYPYSFALHEPAASDGLSQPHVHIQFSSRRDDEQRDLTPQQWFKQPNAGGIPKDPSWFQKQRVYDIREAVAVMTNAALSREDQEISVSHRRLKDRGLERQAPEYGKSHPEGWEQMSTAARKAWRQEEKLSVMLHRAELSASGVRAYEAFHDYAGWKDQATQLLSLDRTYIKDLTRDHVWRFDRSEARILERQESLERTLALAMSREPRHTSRETSTQERSPRRERSPERSVPRQPARMRTPAQHPAPAVERLQRLAASLTHDEPQGPGVRVKLQERERDQGYDLGF